ncbi:MAG: regulatory protein RecX, partial [Pseudoclavibacter sp.]|nr:regulatory protein RecX [Pseudoclavibacter sp.]
PGGAAGGWTRLGLGGERPVRATPAAEAGRAAARQPREPSSEPRRAASGGRPAGVVPFPGPRRREVPREHEGEAEVIPAARRFDAVRSWNTARDRTGRPPIGPRPEPEVTELRPAAPARAAAPRAGAAGPGAAEEGLGEGAGCAAAETALRRALGRSAKSVREARGMLLEACRLDEAQADAVVQRFLRLGYLDDAALAEQIVRRQRERGRGAAAIRQQLHGRGVEPRAAELALASIDLEDEAGRAARLAAARAPRLRGLAADTALRRLVGFLQRRGYDAATSLDAARAALGADSEVAGFGAADLD